jgi:hypothetical protein
MAVRWAVASGNFSSTATWNDGAILGIPTGSDDLFTNTFTVNVNQSFEARTLNNTARARDIATPLMTSNNAPSPVVVSQTSTFSGQPFLYFDRNTGTLANSGGVGANIIKVDFGLGNAPVIDGYTVVPGSNGRGPNTWTFQGSNNDSTWTTLNSVTGQGGNSTYSVSSVGNIIGYRYYRLNISSYNGSAGGEIAEIELYQRFTAALAAGGSFNFNSGSISGSVTSTSPLSAGATNLITVTATTGSVSLALGGSVAPAIASSNLINHSGNCNFTITGGININGIQTGGSISNTTTINKTSAGTITIIGNLNGSTIGNQQTNRALVSNNGNTVVVGNVVGGNNLGGSNNHQAISQTAGTLTITGNITGGQGGSAANEGVLFSGTSMTVNGNIVGGATSVAINTTAPIIVTGNITGSAAAGIITNAPVIVSGSVIAGSSPGITSSPTVAIFVNVSGSVIASATSNAIVIAASTPAASSVVNLAGNLVNVNGKQAIYCQNLFLDNTATTQAIFFTFGGSDRTLYSSDTFPNLPSASNVRFGTTYGPGSGNTGTLRMASPQDVRSGVLTDNTTGSAILSMESLSNEIQTSSDPFAQRLRNLTTVDIIGNLLTAFKK